MYELYDLDSGENYTREGLPINDGKSGIIDDYFDAKMKVENEVMAAQRNSFLGESVA